MKWLWDNFAGALTIPVFIGSVVLLSLFPIGRAFLLGIGILILVGVICFSSPGQRSRRRRINPDTGLPRSSPYPYWTESDNQDNDGD